jgi:hypothetical protein
VVYFAWDLSFTVVAIVLVASVIFTVVRSRIWMVEENKMRVLRLFVDIPQKLLRSFEKSCALRMRRLEREREAFMYGGADGLDLGDDEPEESTATGTFAIALCEVWVWGVCGRVCCVSLGFRW